MTRTRHASILPGVLSFTAALFVAMVAHAAEWQPAESRLKTPWFDQVSPEAALPEYPRPQLVRDEWTNLNGLWDYAIVTEEDESASRERKRPESYEGQILVPFPIESALSGVKKTVKPEDRLWYRRTFERPKTEEGGRVLLHFGAVDWKCNVYVNDQEVGEHTGGYDPFTFDITDALKDGENELVVCVEDPTDEGGQPRGKQILNPHGIWYTAVTGIWQTVWLEPVPKQYIESIRIVPNVDERTVEITVNASGDTETDAVVRVKSPGDPRAPSLSSIPSVHAGKTGEPIVIQLSDAAKLWSPDEPWLYAIDVALAKDFNREPADKVESYFGMRKIEVAKDDKGVNRLMLNGEPLFQYGPLDQGWWPDGLYTPPTDEALKFDVEMTKKFGFNMARKHVKVEPARWYYWCDKLGLIVWQDMPSGDFDKNEESRENYRRELKAMIDALHHFPSIVMWVPFNEGWGQHETVEVAKWTKEYDPTRLVNEASGWHDRGSGDVSDMHNYPGPGMRPVEEDRAVVLGEFGGLGMPVSGHTWQDEKNWGYVSYKTPEELTDAYVGLLTAMQPLIGEGLSAAVYTQTTDVEIEVNGLLTYDRKVVKMDLGRIVAAAKELYGPPPAVATLVPTSQEQKQTWRYTLEEPAEDWQAADFDDSSWKEGEGGFGTEGTPGAVVGTRWDTKDIWLRRKFTLHQIPEGELYLKIHHDEDAQIYVNGELVSKRRGYRGGYGLVPVDEPGKSPLKDGENTIAVHCR
ncbi:MAG TPA: glycoside hydrolase family 2 TIM barrel-domain containing protein, partial [Lacipirellula sp.]